MTVDLVNILLVISDLRRRRTQHRRSGWFRTTFSVPTWPFGSLDWTSVAGVVWPAEWHRCPEGTYSPRRPEPGCSTASWRSGRGHPGCRWTLCCASWSIRCCTLPVAQPTHDARWCRGQRKSIRVWLVKQPLIIEGTIVCPVGSDRRCNGYSAHDGSPRLRGTRVLSFPSQAGGSTQPTTPSGLELWVCLYEINVRNCTNNWTRLSGEKSDTGSRG